MSPSSNNRSRRRFSVPFGRRQIGIGLNRDSVSAAQVVLGRRGQVDVEWVCEEVPAHPLFDGAPTPEGREALIESLTALCARFGRTRAPVHVAFPDPSAILMVFDLDRVPASSRMRNDLIRWRFAKEFSMPANDIGCTSQYLGRDGERHLLYGSAVSIQWLDCLQAGLAAAGVVASSVDVEARYRFNWFHDRLNTGSGGGALISIQPWAWNLLAWDGETRLRFARSHWRSPDRVPGDSESIESLAREFQRILRGLRVSGPDKRMNRVLVTGSDFEARAIAAELDQRLREPCETLSLEASCTFRGEPPKAGIDSVSQALLAAVGQ